MHEANDNETRVFRQLLITERIFYFSLYYSYLTCKIRDNIKMSMTIQNFPLFLHHLSTSRREKGRKRVRPLCAFFHSLDNDSDGDDYPFQSFGLSLSLLPFFSTSREYVRLCLQCTTFTNANEKNLA